jgi:hypothetical protein
MTLRRLFAFGIVCFLLTGCGGIGQTSVPLAPAALRSAHPMIVVKTSDTLNPSFAGIDLYATSGAGSRGIFTISEDSLTNAPYEKPLTITPGNGCGKIGRVSRHGNAFVATVAPSPSPGICTAMTIHDAFGHSQPVILAYTHFAYTGHSLSMAIPAGVTKVTIEAGGAQGGGSTGGKGGTVTATIGVSATPMSIIIGSAGQDGGNQYQAATASGGAGGSIGGAAGGSASDGYVENFGGGGGGGASTVTQRGVPLVVAAGGGGGIGFCNISGGFGGYPHGGAGQTSVSGCQTLAKASGGGGSQTKGGKGGAPGNAGENGIAGTRGAGGVGGGAASQSAKNCSAGGGGGGGYYGGGGGGGACGNGFNILSGAGGGGSSYYPKGATNVKTQNGTQTGNGSMTIIL